MKTSESITKISSALLKAQQSISFAVKSETNPFHKNKYADLPAVIDAVKPALNSNGIVFIQTATTLLDQNLTKISIQKREQEIESNGKIKEKEEENIILCLTTRLLHESGEWIEDTAVIPLPKQDPQGFGSALTYLRRYSLASFIGLYQDDDDANASSYSSHKSINKISSPMKVHIPKNEYYHESYDPSTKLSLCESLDQLKTVYSECMKYAKTLSDSDKYIKEITEQKDKMKEAFKIINNNEEK